MTDKEDSKCMTVYTSFSSSQTMQSALFLTFDVMVGEKQSGGAPTDSVG